MKEHGLSSHHRLALEQRADGPTATSDTKSLFNFADPREVNRWGVVVDGVMGGLSTGFIRQEGDTLSFTGETSLRNNGGFSSIRAGLPSGVLSGYDAVRIRVKGGAWSPRMDSRCSKPVGHGRRQLLDTLPDPQGGMDDCDGSHLGNGTSFLRGNEFPEESVQATSAESSSTSTTRRLVHSISRLKASRSPRPIPLGALVLESRS